MDAYGRQMTCVTAFIDKMAVERIEMLVQHKKHSIQTPTPQLPLHAH